LNETGASILRNLQAVAAEREIRAGEPSLAERVSALKRFQHARFARTYADLMADRRYASATVFFLEDLYGPTDFSERDAQFARVVPALVRLFPREVLETVKDLSALHALSEQLDTAMARALQSTSLDGQSYGRAWRQVGDALSRETQIQLIIALGTAIDRYTRNRLLRHSLRVMRAPAQAAGLTVLQRFLETGFDTFRSMGGAGDFLQIIAHRERALAAKLFSGGSV
jgi:hypothetical protein